MAIFSDNDRSKVNEEIEIDDVDEVVEDDDQEDQDDSANEADDSQDQDDQGDKGKKKPETKPEDTAEYWKTKFQESSREAQIIAEREKEAKAKLEEATKPKEITDDLMKEKYADWDSYDDAVKATLKNQVKLEQEVTALKQSQSEYHNERKWDSKINSFLDENAETEKYPIKDREAFRKFVSKPERKGMNLDVLAAAFVYEVGSTTSKPEKKKGSMLESGSGQGATQKHKSDKKEYTAEDAKVLRENNPREYERLVRSGKLDIKI